MLFLDGPVFGRGEKTLQSYLGWLEKGVDSFNTDDVPGAAEAIRKFYKK